jgi:hypothetical protein
MTRGKRPRRGHYSTATHGGRNIAITVVREYSIPSLQLFTRIEALEAFSIGEMA